MVQLTRALGLALLLFLARAGCLLATAGCLLADAGSGLARAGRRAQQAAARPRRGRRPAVRRLVAGAAGAAALAILLASLQAFGSTAAASAATGRGQGQHSSAPASRPGGQPSRDQPRVAFWQDVVAAANSVTTAAHAAQEAIDQAAAAYQQATGQPGVASPATQQAATTAYQRAVSQAGRALAREASAARRRIDQAVRDYAAHLIQEASRQAAGVAGRGPGARQAVLQAAQQYRQAGTLVAQAMGQATAAYQAAVSQAAADYASKIQQALQTAAQPRQATARALRDYGKAVDKAGLDLLDAAGIAERTLASKAKEYGNQIQEAARLATRQEKAAGQAASQAAVTFQQEAARAIGTITDAVRNAGRDLAQAAVRHQQAAGPGGQWAPQDIKDYQHDVTVANQSIRQIIKAAGQGITSAVTKYAHQVRAADPLLALADATAARNPAAKQEISQAKQEYRKAVSQANQEIRQAIGTAQASIRNAVAAYAPSIRQATQALAQANTGAARKVARKAAADAARELARAAEEAVKPVSAAVRHAQRDVDAAARGFARLIQEAQRAVQPRPAGPSLAKKISEYQDIEQHKLKPAERIRDQAEQDYWDTQRPPSARAVVPPRQVALLKRDADEANAEVTKIKKELVQLGNEIAREAEPQDTRLSAQQRGQVADVAESRRKLKQELGQPAQDRRDRWTPVGEPVTKQYHDRDKRLPNQFNDLAKAVASGAMDRRYERDLINTSSGQSVIEPQQHARTPAGRRFGVLHGILARGLRAWSWRYFHELSAQIYWDPVDQAAILLLENKLDKVEVQELPNTARIQTTIKRFESPFFPFVGSPHGLQFGIVLEPQNNTQDAHGLSWEKTLGRKNWSAVQLPVIFPRLRRPRFFSGTSDNPRPGTLKEVHRVATKTDFIMKLAVRLPGQQEAWSLPSVLELKISLENDVELPSARTLQALRDFLKRTTVELVAGGDYNPGTIIASVSQLLAEYGIHAPDFLAELSDFLSNFSFTLEHALVIPVVDKKPAAGPSALGGPSPQPQPVSGGPNPQPQPAPGGPNPQPQPAPGGPNPQLPPPAGQQPGPASPGQPGQGPQATQQASPALWAALGNLVRSVPAPVQIFNALPGQTRHPGPGSTAAGTGSDGTVQPPGGQRGPGSAQPTGQQDPASPGPAVRPVAPPLIAPPLIAPPHGAAKPPAAQQPPPTQSTPAGPAGPVSRLDPVPPASQYAQGYRGQQPTASQPTPPASHGNGPGTAAPPGTGPLRQSKLANLIYQLGKQVVQRLPQPQPPADQPLGEQPPVEQPPVEQPPVEQPPVEEPPLQAMAQGPAGASASNEVPPNDLSWTPADYRYIPPGRPAAADPAVAPEPAAASSGIPELTPYEQGYPGQQLDPPSDPLAGSPELNAGADLTEAGLTSDPAALATDSLAGTLGGTELGSAGVSALAADGPEAADPITWPLLAVSLALQAKSVSDTVQQDGWGALNPLTGLQGSAQRYETALSWPTANGDPAASLPTALQAASGLAANISGPVIVSPPSQPTAPDAADLYAVVNIASNSLQGLNDPALTGPVDGSLVSDSSQESLVAQQLLSNPTAVTDANNACLQPGSSCTQAQRTAAAQAWQNDVNQATTQVLATAINTYGAADVQQPSLGEQLGATAAQLTSQIGVQIPGLSSDATLQAASNLYNTAPQDVQDQALAMATGQPAPATPPAATSVTAAGPAAGPAGGQPDTSWLSTVPAAVTSAIGNAASSAKNWLSDPQNLLKLAPPLASVPSGGLSASDMSQPQPGSQPQPTDPAQVSAVVPAQAVQQGVQTAQTATQAASTAIQQGIQGAQQAAATQAQQVTTAAQQAQQTAQAATQTAAQAASQTLQQGVQTAQTATQAASTAIQQGIQGAQQAAATQAQQVATAAQDAQQAAATQAQQVATAAQDAQQAAATQAQQIATAAQDAQQAAATQAQQIATAAQDAQQAAAAQAQQIATQTAQTAAAAATATSQATQDAGTAIGQGVQNAGAAVSQTAQNVGTAISQDAQAAGAALSQAAQNVGAPSGITS